MGNEVDKIELDIDRDRIRTILTEAYNICSDILEVGFKVSVTDFVSKIDKFLESNRIASVPVFLDLPSQEHPELRIEVNFQKKSVIARMLKKKKRILLNRYLTKL